LTNQSSFSPIFKFFKRIFRLGVSVIYIGYNWIREKSCRLFGKPVSAACVVLYYHSIPSSSRGAFAEQMDMVKRLTQPVSLNAKTLRLLPNTRYSAITFDDAFEDVIEHAVPELVKRNIPATVFAVVNVLGQTANWWPESSAERNRRIATIEQLRQLPGDWINIGAHTMTHPRLSTLNVVDARFEISRSRSDLEAILGYKIEDFSFPYGDFSEVMIGLCREAGYRRVFTTEPKVAFGLTEEFVVGRVCVEPTDWRIEFQLKLLGGYCWMRRASAVKRRLLTVAKRFAHSPSPIAANGVPRS
jgi:peptidoglycan/xylan/chitin deacetylase (PgdA/CDA1 family)